MNSVKEQILHLRSLHKSYKEIQTLLNCSKGTISFHCGAGQKLKSSTRNKRNRRINADFLKEELGAKCFVCDYSKCLGVLDFHHVHPDGKIDSVSNLLREKTLEMAKAEAKKCILLCANCHREYHNGFFSILPSALPKYLFIKPFIPQ